MRKFVIFATHKMCVTSINFVINKKIAYRRNNLFITLKIYESIVFLCACQNPENSEAATAKSDVCAWAWSYFIVAAGRSGALTEDKVVHASFFGAERENTKVYNNHRIEYIIDEIIDQYCYADNSFRPWIIGFSGGKDSTVLLTLVWLALKKIKETTPAPFQLRRPVYVVCNDTLVENPIISNYVDDVLRQIEHAAIEQDLPIIVRKTIPKLEDSFWVNVIGKGYPVPNNAFRWCTDKIGRAHV